MSAILLFLTLVSVAVAIVTSVIAWRLSREAARRSEARVALLASDIEAEVGPSEWSLPDAEGRAPLFSESEEKSRAPLAMATGVVVVGTAIALIVVLSSGRHPSASAAPVTSDANDATFANLANNVRPAAAAPLELVALTHERMGKGLKVRGVVRNPTKGQAASDLAAVVSVLDAAGTVVGIGRATVLNPVLQPDDQTSFIVSIPEAASGGRYRVSFRAGDRMVPHVDGRHLP
jgi:hypothetical protein